MKTKQSLGWIFVITGSLFLMSGLVVMIFATLRPDMDGSMGGEIVDPSFWVTLANAVMAFIIQLLEVDWTPVRVGVFLIVIGLVMDGGGAYLMVSANDKPNRRNSRSRNKRK